MKVAHIFNELKFSGAEIMYADAADDFQKLGCEMIIIATAKNKGEYSTFFEKANCKVLHFPYPDKIFFISRLIYLYNFLKFIKRESIDVIHIHNSKMKWVMSLCAWLSGINSVYTFHNVFKSKWYSKEYHKLIRWSAKKVFKCKFQTISDSVYDNELKYYNNKSFKIFNWYSKKRFYPGSIDEKKLFRKELNINDSTLVLISIGGCSEIKQHSEILKGLPELIAMYKDVLYLHLGTGNCEKKEIELARELSILNNVRFLGNQSNVRKYLIASDIYIMTSKFEGISITTIEALACKIPTILYNVDGLKDFNKYGNNTFLIEPDYINISYAVKNIYENYNLKESLSDNAEKLVNDKFNISLNSKKIFELYKLK